MRIRKNKKLTPSIIWSTAASSSSPNPPVELLQAHVCVVNRSPWDSPPSPPPPPPLDNPHNHQVIIEGDNDSYGVNGRLALASDNDNSHRSNDDSMKISSDHNNSTTIPHSVEYSPLVADTTIDHNDNDTAVAVVSIQLDNQPPKRKPGRPRKVPVAQQSGPPPVLPPSTPSNPYEFYYYSGFGPSWGKKRSDDQKLPDNNNNNNNNNSIYNKKKKKKNAGSGTSYYTSSSCSRSDEELNFIYDDDDDDDEDDDPGRKRTRKPVKARSLKSLIDHGS